MSAESLTRGEGRSVESVVRELEASAVVRGVSFREGLFVMELACPMRVVGSSVCGGGERSGVRFLFNRTIDRSVSSERELPGGSWVRFMEQTALGISREAGAVCGLSTAALVKNTGIRRVFCDGVEVVAAATAGVDVNGGRAGDPASYVEREGDYFSLGTVNIFVVAGAVLPPGALVKAIVTATEAKTSVLQELAAPSRYSTGWATGSGTDGVIVAAPMDGFPVLTDAGHHSKLGEMIARTVRKAVREALFLETGLSPERQKNIWRRLERFGISGKDLKNVPDEAVKEFENDGAAVGLISMILQLKDETDWGRLSPEEAERALDRMTRLRNGEKEGAGENDARNGEADRSGLISFGASFPDSLVRFLEKEFSSRRKRES